MNEITRAFVHDFTGWARVREDIEAVAVVGSYARGTARAHSDVDLVILGSNPEYYLNDVIGTRTFGTVLTTAREHYGAVESLRVCYTEGLEIEFGFTRPQWADTKPLDPGTLEVASRGMVILLDKAGRLAVLQGCLSQESHQPH